MTTQPAKAVVAFIATFGAALLATLQGRTDLDGATWLDWGIVVLTALVTASAVYATPNKPTGA